MDKIGFVLADSDNTETEYVEVRKWHLPQM